MVALLGICIQTNKTVAKQDLIINGIIIRDTSPVGDKNKNAQVPQQMRNI